jgi:hypothetical protein
MLYKYNNEQLLKKWQPVLDHEELPKIRSEERRLHTAILLENTERAQAEERAQFAAMHGQMINETLPVNFAGTGGYATSAAAAGPVAGFDPILISLIRRNAPVLMGYDIMGVQPMTGPTGLIFAMRSTYANATVNAAATNEALYQEANNFGGNTSLTFTTPFANTNLNPGGSNTSYGAGGGYPNGIGEDLGGTTTLNSMGFSIEKVTVTANTRGLQAGYTLELAQDLKAVHGLDAETELANILSTELLAEINREAIRLVYITATVGAAGANATGVFNLTPYAAAGAGDTYGRWQVEVYKGLVFQMEREANKIMKDTRRGKGNIVVVSTDVGSALAMSGLLDYDSKLSQITGGVSAPDDYTQGTFLGVLNGKIKVYVDPYSVSGADYYVVGYRGASAYDAGLFYCPYVPLQMVRAIDPNTFQPKIGFKTRYGMVANPFAQGYTQGVGALTANSNQYYRKAIVAGLK